MNGYAAYYAVRGGLDPSGEDFIALADRKVGGVKISPFYHYSLQYWVCPCENEMGGLDLGEEYDIETVERVCTKHEATELLNKNKDGWKADFEFEFYYRYGLIATSRKDIVTEKVGISEIQYSDTSNRVMPIYTNSDRHVAAKWALIIANARAYRFAEQEGDVAAGNFNQWPRSYYPDILINVLDGGSNSNTFVREMIRLAGLPASEMSGSHPGTLAAAQNHPYIFFTVIATHTRFIRFVGQPYK